jgi:HlyD family secretion protein
MRKLLIVLVALLLVTGSGVQQAYSADDAKPAVHAATAAKAAPGGKVRATGTIEPEEVVDVGAQVDGPIVSLGADPHAPDSLIGWNAPVEAGTILARVDSDRCAIHVERQRAACARAEAGLAKAKIELESAEAQWKLAQAQQMAGVPSQSQSDFLRAKFNYLEAKPAVTMAEATLAEAQAALREAEFNLSCTVIKSPVKGVVIDRRVNVGQMAATNNSPTSLFLIAKLDNLKIWTSVNEFDLARVHQQQAVRFTVDAYPGKVFDGKVEQIRMNATMTQNVVTYTVVVAVSGTPKELLPYMTACVTFE